MDEKLQATLEARLVASFQQVSDRLDQVHEGLGEMQALAIGVGDLKRVLTNVKTRGRWGEVQLGNLLADLLTPAQYAKNVATRPGSRERVEFAVRLPGRGDDEPCWLPIDAKFPIDDWQRLQDAVERADATAVEASRRALDGFFRQRGEVDPRQVRRAAAHHRLRDPVRADRGTVRRGGRPARAGRRAAARLPRDARRSRRTLSAMLNSLQLGFRTLAIEKRSTEVWRMLGAVKTEFGKFGDVLARARKKLDEAGKTLDDARAARATTIARKLRDVEALPEAEADAPAGRRTRGPSVGRRRRRRGRRPATTAK